MTTFKDLQEAADGLEQRYSDRGLKFSSAGLRGMVPVQGFGFLDGMRFYFRFRSNHAQLRVGPYDRKIEELYTRRVNEDKANRVAKYKAQLDAGDLSEEDFVMLTFSDNKPDVPEPEDSPMYSPHIIFQEASCEGPEPANVYNGFLTGDEGYEIFSHLIDNLVDVPVNKRLSMGTQIWLYEGRQAFDAYLAESNKNNMFGE